MAALESAKPAPGEEELVAFGTELSSFARWGFLEVLRSSEVIAEVSCCLRWWSCLAFPQSQRAPNCKVNCWMRLCCRHL